jgi:hypothetical protein
MSVWRTEGRNWSTIHWPQRFQQVCFFARMNRMCAWLISTAKSHDSESFVCPKAHSDIALSSPLFGWFKHPKKVYRNLSSKLVRNDFCWSSKLVRNDFCWRSSWNSLSRIGEEEINVLLKALKRMYKIWHSSAMHKALSHKGNLKPSVSFNLLSLFTLPTNIQFLYCLDFII